MTTPLRMIPANPGRTTWQPLLRTATLSLVLAGTAALPLFPHAAAAQSVASVVAPLYSDIMVMSGQTFTIGSDVTYGNVTVEDGGVLIISSDVTVKVAGKMLIKGGGRLITGVNSIVAQVAAADASTFELADGGFLNINDFAGISASAMSGPIRTTNRSFSTRGYYFYATSQSSFVLTGDGLPAQVAGLGVSGDNVPILSNDLAVSDIMAVYALVTDGHKLTLLSDATKTADAFSFLGTYTSVEAEEPAEVEAQHYVGGLASAGYRHLAAPVITPPFSALESGGKFNLIQNTAYNSAAKPTAVKSFPNLFRYDEQQLETPNTSFGQGFSRGWQVPTGELMRPGIGYSVNMAGEQTLRYQGQQLPVIDFITENERTVTLTRGNQAGSGWNLLGNPFTSVIDWSGAQIPSGMSGSAWIYEPNGMYTGTYRLYFNNGDGGTSGDPTIPQGQGFFTYLLEGTSSANFEFGPGLIEKPFFEALNRIQGPGLVPTLTKTTSRWTMPQPQAQRSAKPKLALPMLHLSLRAAAGQPQDETLIYFQQGATASLDNRYDAPKMRNVGLPSLFSLAGTQELAANGLAPQTGTAVSVPLGLALPEAGNFTLHLGELANFAAGQRIILEDQLTGQQVDLTKNPDYAFTAKAGSGQRFLLRFEANSVLSTTNAALAAQVAVFPNPAQGSFRVQVPALSGSTVQATLLNSLGQRVRTQQLALTRHGADASFEVSQLARGVYTLLLEAGNTRITKRVVLD